MTNQKEQKELDLKKLIEEGKIIIGSERTLKLAKQNKIKAIILAQNTPESLKNEAKIIAKALGIEIIESEENSKQLGIKLGKPFTALMLGILR